ncbi:MAG TPA: metallophosphoesterase, partial [Cyclobacteriaceae bacterium]|nr:metallophosphoesterase [Cyclobacteriaceae bacterium]
NYQRSVPHKFDPKRDTTGKSYRKEKSGRVDGKFKQDTKFDGVVDTKPDGIIYIGSGAGGAVLYDTEIGGKPEMWKHEPASNWVSFTVKIISDVHSYTYIETEGKKLTFKQYDVKDNEIDSIVITK